MYFPPESDLTWGGHGIYVMHMCLHLDIVEIKLLRLKSMLVISKSRRLFRRLTSGVERHLVALFLWDML